MVTKKEVGQSAVNLVRRTILGLALIIIFIASAYLINSYVIEPYKHKTTDNDTKITNEDNTQTAPVTNKKDDEISIQEKYKALLDMNKDFVGKLYVDAIEETGYNVVQCDNNEKYLTVGFKGETTRYGTLFVDYRNDVKELDTNTIIYGHNMRDGSQLGSLSIYNKLDVYKAFPTIKFNTIYKNSTWKVFAAFIINADKKDDNGYAFPYRTTDFPSDKKFDEFIKDVKSRSYFINDSVDILPTDKILTLSTCDTVFDNARFVLMARLVRENETEDVDVSTAKKNDNQRFPQAWYDKKGKENPFKNTSNFSLD